MNANTQEIYEALLTEILSEQFRVNERIPTEMELAERFGTNRMNAYHAVKRLEADGVVERKKRKGTFVRRILSPNILTDLKTQIANTVHVFSGRKLATSFSHWNDATFSNLENILSSHGLTVFYHETSPDRAGLDKMLQSIVPTSVRGLVFFPGLGDIELLSENVDMLDEYRDRLFLFDFGAPLERSPCHTLSLDPFGEGVAAGDYLHRRGYTKILFATSEVVETAYWANERLEGLRSITRSLSKGRTEVEPVVINSAEDFLQRIPSGSMTASDRVAFVPQNDSFAAELIEYGEKAGLRVGEDYAILSFDDDPRFRKHNLTTVAPPVEHIGRILARMIAEWHWPLGEDGVRLSIKIRSKIIERSTCP